jgi:hypothetical protein
MAEAWAVSFRIMQVGSKGYTGAGLYKTTTKKKGLEGNCKHNERKVSTFSFAYSKNLQGPVQDIYLAGLSGRNNRNGH